MVTVALVRLHQRINPKTRIKAKTPPPKRSTLRAGCGPPTRSLEVKKEATFPFNLLTVSPTPFKTGVDAVAAIWVGGRADGLSTVGGG